MMVTAKVSEVAMAVVVENSWICCKRVPISRPDLVLERRRNRTRRHLFLWWLIAHA